MTHILITGATGFIGRNILQELSKRDVRISIIARKDSKIPAGKFRVIRTDDVFDTLDGFWEEACDDVDVVIHNAWYTEDGLFLINSINNIACMKGTLHLAECCAKAGVARFVGVGTCHEYDLQLGYLSTSAPLRPNSIYGAAKAGTFFALSEFLPRSNVDFAWCRVFYVYGEGENPKRLAAYLHKNLSEGKPVHLTRGDQIRDYLEVGEVGRQIAEVTLSNVQGAVNICSGVPVTVRDFALKIAEEYDRVDLLKFGSRPENTEEMHCIFGEPFLRESDDKAKMN